MLKDELFNLIQSNNCMYTKFSKGAYVPKVTETYSPIGFVVHTVMKMVSENHDHYNEQNKVKAVKVEMDKILSGFDITIDNDLVIIQELLCESILVSPTCKTQIINNTPSYRHLFLQMFSIDNIEHNPHVTDILMGILIGVNNNSSPIARTLWSYILGFVIAVNRVNFEQNKVELKIYKQNIYYIYDRVLCSVNNTETLKLVTKDIIKELSEGDQINKEIMNELLANIILITNNKN